MPHQILNNRKRRRLDIRISPIDPAMSGTQRRAKQPIPRLGHQFPPTRLGLETMPALHILLDLLAEIFLDNGDLAKVHLRVRIVLHLLQHAHEHAQSLVTRVGYQERQVNQVVWVGEVSQVREEHG